MGNIKKIESITKVVVVAAIVLSMLAVVFSSVTAIECSGFVRWISIGDLVVNPLALLAVSVCSAIAYLVGTKRGAEQHKIPVFACSVSIASISAMYILVLLTVL